MIWVQFDFRKTKTKKRKRKEKNFFYMQRAHEKREKKSSFPYFFPLFSFPEVANCTQNNPVDKVAGLRDVG
jgi:hypothetical protein